MKKNKKLKQKKLYIKKNKKAVKRKIRAGQNPYMFRYELIDGKLIPFDGGRKKDLKN